MTLIHELSNLHIELEHAEYDTEDLHSNLCHLRHSKVKTHTSEYTNLHYLKICVKHKFFENEFDTCI